MIKSTIQSNFLLTAYDVKDYGLYKYDRLSDRLKYMPNEAKFLDVMQNSADITKAILIELFTT